MGYRVIIYIDGTSNEEDEIYSSRKKAEEAAEEAIKIMKWDPVWENSDLHYRIEEV